MAPAEARPGDDPDRETAPSSADRRVLVVDADETVRSDAHNRSERYGCVVETAHDGREAVFMVRNSMPYDVIIADIRLPDMTGYELMVKLQEIMDPVPLVLMTGFGYDPGHSIVKARAPACIRRPSSTNRSASTSCWSRWRPSWTCMPRCRRLEAVGMMSLLIQLAAFVLLVGNAAAWMSVYNRVHATGLPRCWSNCWAWPPSRRCC